MHKEIAYISRIIDCCILMIFRPKCLVKLYILMIGLEEKFNYIMKYTFDTLETTKTTNKNKETVLL